MFSSLPSEMEALMVSDDSELMMDLMDTQISTCCVAGIGSVQVLSSKGPLILQRLIKSGL